MKRPTRARHWLADRAVLLSLALMALVFTVDSLLPLGVASAVPYTFAVLIALKARSTRYAWYLALGCAVLTIAKLFLFSDRGTTELWKVIVNRCLALFTIGMTVFLGEMRRRSDEKRHRAEEETRLHLATLAHMERLETAGQLAASLAHELNQPLGAVSLQSEIATHLVSADGKPPREPLLTVLREITEQSQRAGEILRGLKNFVQKAAPRRQVVNVNDAIRAVSRLIEPYAEQKEVEVILHLANEPPSVLADRVQIEQVMLNLLQNAVEAVEAAASGPRTVTVTTGRGERRRILVTVCDTGIGFAPDEVDRLFERFYTTKPHGLGMGLHISRALVEAHGGQLRADLNPESGSTFTLTLPAAPKP